MEDKAARTKRLENRAEDYLHSAKRVAIRVFGPETAHGHHEVIARIANTMATMDAAEMLAEKLDLEE